MARRNAVRRKQLDDEQQQEAMKVLKKYVLNKYRGSMIEIPDLLPDTNISEHYQRPQTLLLGSRDFERQSTTFSFLPHGYDAQAAISPTFTSFDILEEPKVLKEEIKYDAKKDTILTYPVRVIKAAMQIQITKQLLCLLSIALVGLIGGAVFQHLEQPNQIAEIFAEQNTTLHRHRHFSLQILLELTRNECFAKLHKSNSSQLSHKNSFCQHSMMGLLQRYDHTFRRDHGMTKPWDWDYWNSVFFAGTVFTTIGYGILAPKTIAGRIAFIIYALISIPLLLGVLNVFGRPFLESFQDRYTTVRKKCSKIYRHFHPRLGGTSFQGSVDLESSPLTKNEDEEDEHQVPWQIAIIILVVFVVMCAWMFTLWEDWTFFESFYFTFSSLTTVGFGDLVPQHPRFALVLFVFYLCGLFVVSTVYAYIQAKIEDKYMWALQLVDQAGEETHPQRDDPSPVKFDGNVGTWPADIKWRQDSVGGGTDSGALTRQSTVLMANPDGAPVNCPPSVNAFLRSMSTKRNSLARSESVISKSSYGSKWRPFSNSPSSSEQLTPVENKKMWLGADSPGPYPFGPKPSSSAPSLAPQRNLTAGGGGALSVITEDQDEDTLHARRSTQRSTHVSEIFPIKRQSTVETDPGGESFEMIDDGAISDAALEDVVEIASSEDDQSQTSENDKVLELPSSLAVTPSSSERTRRLQRVPAQDLETPTTEIAPPFPPPEPPKAEEEKDDDEVQITGL